MFFSSSKWRKSIEILNLDDPESSIVLGCVETNRFIWRMWDSGDFVKKLGRHPLKRPRHGHCGVYLQGETGGRHDEKMGQWSWIVILAVKPWERWWWMDWCRASSIINRQFFWIAIENGPVEIVDFPMKKGGIFPMLREFRGASWDMARSRETLPFYPMADFAVNKGWAAWGWLPNATN